MHILRLFSMCLSINGSRAEVEPARHITPKYKTRCSLPSESCPQCAQTVNSHSLFLSSRELFPLCLFITIWHKKSPFINLESIMLPILQLYLLVFPQCSSCQTFSSKAHYTSPSRLFISCLTPYAIQLVPGCNRLKKSWAQDGRRRKSRPIFISGLWEFLENTVKNVSLAW